MAQVTTLLTRAELLPTELKNDLELMKLLKIMLRSWLIQRKDGVKELKYKIDPQIIIRVGYILSHYFIMNNRNDYLFFGKNPQTTSGSVSDNFISTIMRLELIDTSKISWDKILSIREDSEAHKKLRRLRLIFEKDYSGKPFSFIEDDILSRIEDYENIVKDWKLETQIGLLEQIISSKSFPAFLGGSIAALFLNSPEIAGASVLSGTCIEIGKIAIEYDLATK